MTQKRPNTSHKGAVKQTLVTKSIRLEDLGYELRMVGRCAEEAARNNLGLETMVAAAQAFCPVDTGAFMGSIIDEGIDVVGKD